MEDDVTRANRADALRLGFGLAMTAAIGLYAFSGSGGLTAREVIHLIVSVGLGTSMLRFGFLERRAHRLG
jgi:predicted MPP superfamily phosphohydrolase